MQWKEVTKAEFYSAIGDEETSEREKPPVLAVYYKPDRTPRGKIETPENRKQQPKYFLPA
jgi:hypothetical protein